MPTPVQRTATRIRVRHGRPLAACLLAALVVGVAMTGAVTARSGADRLEGNDARSSATQLGDGGSYTGLTLHDAGDEDYFAVNVTDGETISVDVGFDDDAGDVDVALLDPDDSVLTISETVTDDESIAETASMNGTYYVRVYAYNGASPGYNITVNTTAEDSLEPDSDRATATSVDGGQTYYEARIASSDDVDYYAVEVDAGDTIGSELLFDGETADLDLELVDADGATVATSYYGTDSESIEHTVDDGGTYYLRVDAFSGAPADYVHSIDAPNASATAPAANESDGLEDNDGTASATQVGSGDSYTGLTVHDTSDVDYFAVDADAGDRVTANLTFNSSADLDLELQDGSGQTLRTAYFGAGNETLDYAVAEGGTYYVVVEAFDGEPAGYDLAIDTVGTTGQPDSLEPNDGPENATMAGQGDSYTDLTLSSSGDADYFAVAADAGDRVTAELSVPSSSDFDLELRDSSGTTLDGAYDGDGGEQLSHAVAEDGIYYVVATPHSGAPAEYDLTVDTETVDVGTDELEPNGDHRSATTVEDATSYTDVAIGAASDVDYYAVEADAGDTVTAALSSPSDADLDLVLEDVSGTALAMSYYGTDGERIAYEVDSSGTYYVRVDAFEGAPAAYDLSVGTGMNASQPGLADGADLRSIEAGNTASGTVDYDDPTIDGFYAEPVTFEGEAGETVTITMAADGGDGYLALRGPDGEYVAADEAYPTTDDSAIEGYELESTGQYTIVATSATGDATFEYTLSLSTATTDAQADSTPATPNALAQNASQQTTSGASGPGFGPAVALVALLAAALLARRR